MKDPRMQRAAGGRETWAALATDSGGEACEPLLYSNTNLAEKQERIFERLASDHRRAQLLAAHHLGLAERFASEAEALADLLRQGEALQ